MQRGFMLIELVLVIVIIAIAAALVFPHIGDWIAAYDLNIAARQLAADLRLLQQMTINSDGLHTPRLTFYTTGYYTALSGNSVQPKRQFPSTVQISGLPSPFTFSIDGPPTVGGTIVLRRTDGKGIKKIIIQVQTGRVRIE